MITFGVWWLDVAFIAALITTILTRYGGPVFLLIYRKVYAYIISLLAEGYNKATWRYKEKLFEDLKARKSALARNLRVLEIGVGSGANFLYYPIGTYVICVDPNPEFAEYIKKHAGRFPVVEFITAPGENMAAVHDESVDAVVCTLVLCNVADQVKVIAEAKRVLKPGGKLYYLEHVRAPPDTWLYSIQNWLDHVWYYVSDGCTLRSEVWKHLDAAGFAQVNYEKFDVKKLKLPLLRPHLMGTATKHYDIK